MNSSEINRDDEQLICLHISANLDFSDKPKMVRSPLLENLTGKFSTSPVRSPTEELKTYLVLINTSQPKAEGNILLNNFYVIHILEKNIILIGKCKGKAIRRADFHILVEIKNDVIKSLNKNSSYYIGYDFTSHYDSIEFEKWNLYEKCNIYLYA